MKTQSSLVLVVVIGALSAWSSAEMTLANAQGQLVIPPGVPEPGLIIWGTVMNETNPVERIQISSAIWSVTDGRTTNSYSQATRPPVQIISLEGQSHYVLEVPFDTRRFGSVVLSDPAVEGIASFELLTTNAPPTYTLMPTINGVLAKVRSIDLGPGSGNSVPVANFNAAVRGRILRVDLSIVPIVDSYEAWAARIWGHGNPEGAPGADPDKDGLTNAGEYAAGTNPRDPGSVLRILSITLLENQARIGWQSVTDKRYVLEAAPRVNGTWTAISSNRASSSAAQISVNRTVPDAGQFYRVRVLQP